MNSYSLGGNSRLLGMMPLLAEWSRLSKFCLLQRKKEKADTLSITQKLKEWTGVVKPQQQIKQDWEHLEVEELEEEQGEVRSKGIYSFIQQGN